jgi:hypothetical protein
MYSVVHQQLPFSGNQFSLGYKPEFMHERSEGWIWTKTGPRLPEGEAGDRAYILGYENKYEVRARTAQNISHPCRP